MAILKRKIGGAWVEVTRDFPTPIPVEITQTDVQTATGTFALSASGTNPAIVSVEFDFYPDIIIFGPKISSASGSPEPMTGCFVLNGDDVSFTYVEDDDLDSGRGGFYYGTIEDVQGTNITFRFLGLNYSSDLVSVNGKTIPWTAIKYT